MQENFTILNQGAALDVPHQTSTILSSKTLPRCESGLPHDTQNRTGITGDVLERPPVQEGQPSTIFHNSKNLAFCSQELEFGTIETARKRECEMKRESLRTSIPSLHFHSGSGMLQHADETYSHSGIMDYPRILF